MAVKNLRTLMIFMQVEFSGGKRQPLFIDPKIVNCALLSDGLDGNATCIYACIIGLTS